LYANRIAVSQANAGGRAPRPAVSWRARLRFAGIATIALGAALLWRDGSHISMANPVPPVPAQATEQKGLGSLVEAPQWVDGKPSFVLDDLTGARHDLANSSGRVVLVHFFATWCEPCREELPALQRLLERSRDSGLTIFAVSVGEPDARVRRFFEPMPTSYPVVLDRDRAASKAWRVEMLPTTYVLDRDLKPRFVVEGEFRWDEIKGEQLLNVVPPLRQDR
jgi:thiol-disulfide isomerase/thioredoxin